MKKILTLVITGFLAFSCSKNDANQIKIDPDNEISFQVKLINTDENFVSKAKSLKVKHKSAGWFRNDTGKIDLWRYIGFDLELENGKILELNFSYSKNEVDENLLLLEDEDLLYGRKNWDYKSFEIETSNFYKSFDSFSVGISNNGQYISYGQESLDFSFVNSEKVLLNGLEKSYITIEFQGDAYGLHDPDGTSGVYKITNGTFKGVIE